MATYTKAFWDDFEVEPFLAALSGDAESLSLAFTWAKSPQGHNFWAAQRLVGVISPEGQAALLEIKAAWEAQGAKPQENYSSEFLKSCAPWHIKGVLAGDHKELMTSFSWSKSPQGFDFWSGQYNYGITNEGRAALAAILAKLAPATPLSVAVAARLHPSPTPPMGKTPWWEVLLVAHEASPDMFGAQVPVSAEWILGLARALRDESE